MSEKNSKQERLKIVVLLLMGFIIGFATHAFTSLNEVSEAEIAELLISETATSSDESTQYDSSAGDISLIDSTVNSGSRDGYSLSVIDQSAGNVVHVSQVELKQDSWIAIREDLSGALGNVLGAQRYPSGTHTGSVELLRGTESGVVYYSVIYIDDGDKIFDHEKDILLTNKDGKIFAVKFRTY